MIRRGWGEIPTRKGEHKTRTAFLFEAEIRLLKIGKREEYPLLWCQPSKLSKREVGVCDIAFPDGGLHVPDLGLR